jgi:hypothetical protein
MISAALDLVPDDQGWAFRFTVRNPSSRELSAQIQEAITAGRYIVDAHFEKRARTRKFSVNDAKKIIATATPCAEYPDATILAGGTSWRVTGTALDGTMAKVGLGADHASQNYRDPLLRLR